MIGTRKALPVFNSSLVCSSGPCEAAERRPRNAKPMIDAATKRMATSPKVSRPR